MIKIGKNISSFSTYSCQPKNKYELKNIIKERIYKEGFNCNLNDIDVSLIDDMSYLFVESEFNGNISKWDVSNVTDMGGMFTSSEFNRDISKWDVQNATDISCMFKESKFNQDISNWNINKDCFTHGIFNHCQIKEEYKPKSLQK